MRSPRESESSLVGMILAAGFGTRMRPLTDVCPKPCLPFLNTPIIAQTLAHFVRAGVHRIGINLHHLPDAIETVVVPIVEAWRTAGHPLDVTFVREDPIRDSGGGIAGLWQALGRPETTAVVVNADTIMDVDLASIAARHRDRGRRATLAVRPRSQGHPGRIFVTDDRITGLRSFRGGGVEHEFMGIHVLSPPVLEAITEAARDGVSSVVTDVYMPMLERGEPIGADVQTGFWVALDNPALLLEATTSVLTTPSLYPLVQLSDSGVTVAAGAVVAPEATLKPPVVIGPSATIQQGAVVGPLAAVDGVVADGSCRVSRCVVAGMGAIEGEWSDSVAVGGRVATVESQ